MKYPIYEHFYSFQGEGCHVGTSAYFIRFYGCPVKCSWCDSSETWNKKQKKNIQQLTKTQIYNLINPKCEFVVLTGGEPCIYNLHPLINFCKNETQQSFKFHIETCGAFNVPNNIDWLTVSPKLNKLPLSENVKRANEIKLVIENNKSIEFWVSMLNFDANTYIWLYPEWSQAHNPEILNYISEYVKQRGYPFRAGYQVHKIYNVDILDKNCKSGDILF